jgi:hypothetical protein
MLAVPTVTPETVPLTTLAIPDAVLLHTPPPTLSPNVIVLPVHTMILDGDNATGVTRTVTALTAEQPATFV